MVGETGHTVPFPLSPYPSKNTPQYQRRVRNGKLTPGHLPRTYYAKSRNAVKRWDLAPSHWGPPGTSPRCARGVLLLLRLQRRL